MGAVSVPLTKTLANTILLKGPFGGGKTMKYIGIFMLVSCLSVSLHAYQTKGGGNRANFNGATQGQSVGQEPRAFSNYQNRGWGQGVQTQAVQTNVAGSSVADFEKKPLGKTQAAAQVAPKPAASAPQQTSGVAVQPSTATAAQVPGAADAAAMMQQVQGMMNSMGGNLPTGNGMPDLSALMGGAAAPASAPAKK